MSSSRSISIGEPVIACFSVDAFHILHHDEGSAVIFLNVVDGADVRVIQSGGGARFPLETFEGLRIFRDVVRKKFQGDETTELGVFGLVDHAHSAAAEFFDDAVVRDRFGRRGMAGSGMRGGF